MNHTDSTRPAMNELTISLNIGILMAFGIRYKYFVI